WGALLLPLGPERPAPAVRRQHGEPATGPVRRRYGRLGRAAAHPAQRRPAGAAGAAYHRAVALRRQRRGAGGRLGYAAGARRATLSNHSVYPRRATLGLRADLLLRLPDADRRWLRGAVRQPARLDR